MLVKCFNSVQAQPDGSYALTTNCSATARLWFVTDDILRLRVSFDGKYAEHSYALVTTAWDDDLDDLMAKERRRVHPLQPSFEETETGFVFTTKTMRLTLGKKGALVVLTALEGNTIYSSLKDRSFEQDHLGRVLHYSAADYQNDHYYGFGEASGGLDKKGRHIKLCPRDSIGLNPENGMPMYKHIPFYIKIAKPSLHAVGLFYNSSFDATFDLGNERSGYWDRYSYYCADGGDIDLFLINGPTAADVVKGYTYLTGTTALPPKHALGFTMSTMYYAELEKDCDEEIYQVIEKFRREDLPVDNFWLASGYSSGEADNLRYTFNWNYRRFPNPKGFFEHMEELGVNVIPNLKPGVLQHHPYLEYYKEHDALIKEPDGKENYLGTWWGGPGYFVDFTGPKGRDAWKELLKQNILSLGCTTVWNDNNEMDGVEDRLAYVDAEGKGGTMAEYKAIHSNMMAFLAHEAMDEAWPNVRPYVINRAGYAGIQRYAQVWGGDNLTCWPTLKYNVAMILGMGLSGCANMGCDIGGFTGPCPDSELLLRWIQNGVFQPRFVLNSANTDNTVTQPFMYPEVLDEVREAFHLRCRLLPYWYSLFAKAYEEGAPIVRPLFYNFPADAQCLTDESMTFMLGDSLLVANVLEEGAKERTLYLPAGTTWYDFYDPSISFEGGQEITVPVDLSSIPLYIPGECIIPMSDDIKVIKRDKLKHLAWLIASEGRDLKFTRYDDDGVSNDYKNGVFLKTHVTVSGEERVTIRFKDEGTYPNTVKTEEIFFVSPHKGALMVTLDGRALKRFLIDDDYYSAAEGWYYNASKRLVQVKYRKPQSAEYGVMVSTEHFDLIGMENNGLNDKSKLKKAQA